MAIPSDASDEYLTMEFRTESRCDCLGTVLGLEDIVVRRMPARKPSGEASGTLQGRPAFLQGKISGATFSNSPFVQVRADFEGGSRPAGRAHGHFPHTSGSRPLRWWGHNSRAAGESAMTARTAVAVIAGHRQHSSIESAPRHLVRPRLPSACLATVRIRNSSDKRGEQRSTYRVSYFLGI